MQLSIRHSLFRGCSSVFRRFFFSLTESGFVAVDLYRRTPVLFGHIFCLFCIIAHFMPISTISSIDLLSVASLRAAAMSFLDRASKETG